MKSIAMGILLVLLSGCTDAEGARETLRKNGYEQISIGGYSFMGCNENDFFATKFSAINKMSGERVEGSVCSGLLFKNSTIRFD